MTQENLITLIVGIISISVPIYVLFKGQDKLASVIYGIIGILAGPSWALALVLFRESTDLSSALFWNRAIYINAILIAPLFFVFSKLFPVRRKIRFELLLFTILPPLVLIVTLFIPGTFIEEIILNRHGNSIEVGPAYYVWMLWFISLMGMGMLSMFSNYRKTKGAFRQQTKYIVIGAIFPSLGTLPTNAILPAFGIYEYIWIGPFFMIIMNLIVVYGLTRIRFLSGREIVKKFTGPVLSFALDMAMLVAVLKIINNRIFGLTGENTFIILILVVFTRVIFSYSLMNSMVNSLYAMFGISQFDISKVNAAFISNISTTLKLSKVTASYKSILKKFIKPKKLYIILTDSEVKRIRTITGQNHFKKDFEEMLTYILRLEKESNPIVLRELEYKVIGSVDVIRNQAILKLLGFMRSNGFNVIHKFQVGTDKYGICFIGATARSRVYSVEDIDFITTLTESFAIGVARSLLYKKVEDFNDTLKDKIDLQTRELKDKVEALETAQQRERDMLDILGHELRTPLSIIRNAFELIELKKKKGKLSDEELKKYIEKGKESIRREIEIVENMLNATKITSSHVVVRKVSIDMVDVIEDSIEGHKERAKEKSIEIEFEKPDKPEKYPKSYGDRTATQRVMDNLLSNAVKYTDEGRITLSLSYDENFVGIHVKDTGKGIPEDEIDNLGKKFYRVDQYLDQEKDLKMVRPGGTGIGLYVVYGLVDEMNGRVEVESKLGEGSTFSFYLPRYKGQITNEIERKEADVFRRRGMQ